MSIVIPCYNQGRFLRDAIDSVLAQTYPVAELVVVDDGSTDETGAVARSYGEVRYIAQRNQGVHAARNAGLRASTGEYIVFLDADDRLHRHAVATGIAALAGHPEWGFVSGHVRVIAENGTTLYTPTPRRRAAHGYLELLRGNYIWSPGAVMYRRHPLDTLKGFSGWAGASADYELNLRIARSFPVGCHGEVILDYRRHARSMSNDPAYMLKSAVTVRLAERTHARRLPGGRDAWRHGIDVVRLDYGERLIAQMTMDAIAPGRRGRVVVGAWYLLRYYPSGVTRVLRGILKRMAGRLGRPRIPDPGRSE